MNARIKSFLLKLKSTGNLPSPSGVSVEILKSAKRENVAIKDIAKIIRLDPSFSGLILQYVNSPHIGLGLNRPIAIIDDAVKVLGIQKIQQLSLSLSIVSNTEKGPCKDFDYQLFWSLSLATGVAAKLLSEEVNVCSPDEAFTAGLLSRIGVLALANLYPNVYGDMLRQSNRDNKRSLLDYEKQGLEINHIELSSALLQDWGLPLFIIEAIEHYENIDNNTTDNSRKNKLANVLNIASIIAGLYVASPAQRQIRLPILLSAGANIGIDEDTMKMVFDMTKTQCEEWGRLLNVSIPESGTFDDLQEQVKNVNKEKSEHLSNLTVLVVDDDPSMLEMLSIILEGIGYNVIKASTGESALQLYTDQNPHIIVTDWMMPGMTGIDLCRKIRELRNGRLTYIIMLTQLDNEDDLVDAFNAGIDDFITKPLNERVLESRIQAGARLVRLNEELEQEKKEGSRYLDTVEVIIISFNIQGNITLINRKGCEILGYKENELLGKDWVNTLIPENNQKLVKLKFDRLKNNKLFTLKDYQFNVRTKSGIERTISWYGNIIIDENGIEKGFLCSGQDITEKLQADKEREQMYIQTQQAQKMQAIGQLTGGIAHDFNNQLVSILGYAELSKDLYANNNNPKLDKYLSYIIKSAEKSRDLVSNLMIFSQAKNGVKENTLLISIIEDSIKLLYPILPKTIEISSEINGSIPMVFIDSEQIYQILMNLCINARDAIKESGKILVRLRHVTNFKNICSSCKEPVEGEYVELSIIDSGKGIDADSLSQIFDPFFTSKSFGSGVGMGLSVVHGVIHNHNGHIFVHTVQGKGTSVSLYFPLAELTTNQL